MNNNNNYYYNTCGYPAVHGRRRNIPYDETKINSSSGLQSLNIVQQCVDRTKVHFVAHCIINYPVSLPPKSLYPSFEAPPPALGHISKPHHSLFRFFCPDDKPSR